MQYKPRQRKLDEAEHTTAEFNVCKELVVNQNNQQALSEQVAYKLIGSQPKWFCKGERSPLVKTFSSCATTSSSSSSPAAPARLKFLQGPQQRLI